MNLIYFLLLILNSLLVNATETCFNVDCDEDTKLLTQLMQFFNNNQNLSLHILNINERLNKLELQTLKCEEKIKQLEQQNVKDKQNTPNKTKKETCVNEKNSPWIVIQRRKDGSVDFFRNWEEYKEGFGNKNGEFFIGLEELHNLTDGAITYELQIEMESYNGDKHYANYDHFIVGSECENYKLKNLGRYHGNAGDNLNYHLAQWFSTYDRENDQNPNENCSKKYGGGWWYNECHESNLNGRYFPNVKTIIANGIQWYKVTGYNTSLKFVEMKIRPRYCQ